jgi:hypothetical protein
LSAAAQSARRVGYLLPQRLQITGEACFGRIGKLSAD